MNKNELLTELNTTADEFLQTLSSFTNEEINTVPFEGSWTPGQVGEHILKSASGVLTALNGPVKATDRNAQEHVAMLRKIFLDFSIKMKGPDSVQPSDEPKVKDELINALAAAFAGIREATETKDLSETCTAFPLPNVGELTRVEFVNFISVHTKRHTHQLENIKKKMAAK